MDIYKRNDIIQVDFDYEYSKDWEQWILLHSDEHFDSKECDRKLLKKHHEQAKDRGAHIFKFGDTFDCMGGKYDPRTHKGDLRPEYQVPDYFDALIKEAVGFYRDYPVSFVGYGNHEQNVLKRHETDLTDNLAKGIGAITGTYAGYIRFKFSHPKHGATRSFLMYYNHGNGGNSPVTKGVIQSNRRAVAFDADLFVSGHNHNGWELELTRQFVDQEGNVKVKPMDHINLSTYKDSGDWEREKGFPAPNKGGVWLRFYHENNPHTVKYEIIRAR